MDEEVRKRREQREERRRLRQERGETAAETDAEDEEREDEVVSCAFARLLFLRLVLSLAPRLRAHGLDGS